MQDFLQFKVGPWLKWHNSKYAYDSVFFAIRLVNRRQEKRNVETLETNRVSDSDTDNTDTGPLDGSYLAKYCPPVVWIAVSNKNGHILDADTVAVRMVEDLRPHQSEPIGSVRTSATILNLSDCIYYIAFDSKTGQIEVECCFVSYTRSNTTDSNSIHV